MLGKTGVGSMCTPRSELHDPRRCAIRASSMIYYKWLKVEKQGVGLRRPAILNVFLPNNCHRYSRTRDFFLFFQVYLAFPTSLLTTKPLVLPQAAEDEDSEGEGGAKKSGKNGAGDDEEAEDDDEYLKEATKRREDQQVLFAWLLSVGRCPCF